ncbi:hypothetical protein [Echinicola shivajiensis]|uniref:hypothetical protein n=1 Tax=Echinicola shivajiensis TaxID=1035916 RepID=UPI001BFBF9E5|nr:hypothetical protein [Echinicola shivajiensis]
MERFNYQILLMLIIIFSTIIIWTIGFFDDFPRQDINCIEHYEFFKSEINRGRVKEKYIDYNNHEYKIVKIENGNKVYKLLLNLEKDKKYFEALKVSDIVNKASNSFIIEINGNYSFKLGYVCPYDTIYNAN